MGKGVAEKLQKLAAMLTVGKPQFFQRNKSLLTSHAFSSNNLLAKSKIDFPLPPNDYRTRRIWPLSGFVNFDVVVKFEDFNLHKRSKAEVYRAFSKHITQFAVEAKKTQDDGMLAGIGIAKYVNEKTDYESLASDTEWLFSIVWLSTIDGEEQAEAYYGRSEENDNLYAFLSCTIE